MSNEYSNVKSVTVNLVDFNDLLAKRTGNLFWEESFPSFLRELIENNVDVIIEDEEGTKHKLQIKNDEFEMIPF